MGVDERLLQLDVLAEDGFPKQCPSCGKTYHSVEDYVRETDKVYGSSSGIKQAMDEGNAFLEVFRNCACGSTLVSLMECQRDYSEAGCRRRELFDQCLASMVEGGIEQETARDMLRRLIRNEA